MLISELLAASAWIARATMTRGETFGRIDDWDRMTDASPPTLGTRLLHGAIAGFAATMVMTSAMARLHRRLPERERYPLPPREITERITGGGEPGIRDRALAAHFLYGGLCGGVLAALRQAPGLGEGAGAGVAVWAASYFGWVPGFGILKPASAHPARRNALMIGAHLLWGAATAAGLRELRLARRTMLNGRPLADAKR